MTIVVNLGQTFAEIERRWESPATRPADPARVLMDVGHLIFLVRQLARERDEARRVCESLAGRCAGQSELLAGRAEKGGEG